MFNIEFWNLFTALDGAAWLSTARESASQLIGWIQTKYAEAPALVFGVGIALVLPAIATIGAILRMVLPANRPKRPVEPATVRTKPASAWRQSAWLELDRGNTTNFPIGDGIVRIGRETDNDLCLSDPTVHRYHAALERTPEAEYIISYVGDPDRDGLLINGQPTQQRRLRGGEVLEIGAIKLRFAVSPA